MRSSTKTLLALAGMALAGVGAWFAFGGFAPPAPQTPAEFLARAREMERKSEDLLAERKLAGEWSDEEAAKLERAVADAYADAIAQAPPSSEEAAEAEWSMIERARERGDLEGRDLLNRYDEFLAKHPESERVRAMSLDAAKLLRDLGLEREAIERFRDYAREYPDDDLSPEALFEVVALLKKMGDYEAAEAAATELIEKAPESKRADDALYERANLRADKLDRLVDALLDFAEIAKERPDSPQGRVARARRRELGEQKLLPAREKKKLEHYGGKELSFSTHFEATPEQIAALNQQGLETTSHSMTLRFATNEGRYYAASRMELLLAGGKPLDEAVTFQLDQYVELTRFAIDGEEVETENKGNLWRAKLAKPLPAGASFTLEAEYKGHGSGGFGGAVHRDGGLLTVMSFWHPIVAWGGASPVAMDIVVPRGMTAVACGELEGSEEVDDPVIGEATLFHWRSADPLKYTGVAVGKYERAAREMRPGLALEVYAFPERAEHSESYLDEMEKFIAFGERELAPFPYRRLAVVETPGLPGGYGPATLLVLGSAVFGRGVGSIEKLLAHEGAHQWFGNYVSANQFTGSHPWLSEGFATYVDLRYTEDVLGPEAATAMALDLRSSYVESLAAFDDQPILDVTDGPLYQALTYDKGALVLRALRHVVGEEAFDEGVRLYLRRHAHSEVTVDDFEAAIEEVSGQTLDWFFEQWLHRAGMPRYKIESVDAARDGDGWRVEVRVAQIGDAAFQGPIDARVAGATNDDEAWGRLEYARGQREATVTIAAPFRPVRVEIDPEAHILKYPALDELEREIEGE